MAFNVSWESFHENIKFVRTTIYTITRLLNEGLTLIIVHGNVSMGFG